MAQTTLKTIDQLLAGVTYTLNIAKQLVEVLPVFKPSRDTELEAVISDSEGCQLPPPYFAHPDGFAR